MEIQELSLKDALLIIPRLYRDERGFFFESYQQGLGLPSFVQDNHSYSKKGVIRGMHFQLSPMAQAKLVRVAVGQIYDVIVDIRIDSPTFGQWEGVYLDDKIHQQLFVPEGFAHGFQVISEEAHVLYKVTAPYHPQAERNFRFDDPEVGIEWPLKESIVSERDRNAPSMREATL